MADRNDPRHPLNMPDGAEREGFVFPCFEEIRSRRDKGETLRDLADVYGLTHRTVYDICAGVLWSEK